MFYGRGPSKTGPAVSTAGTTTFNESDIPGGGQVKQFIVSLSGSNYDYDSLTQIVCKAGGRQVWNVNELQHAAFLQRYGKKAGPAASASRFSIPFYFGGVAGMALGFAPRAAAVEISVDATPESAPSTLLAYLIDETPTTHYPMFVQSDSNIAASATNGRYPVTQPGLLRGFCIARTTSITDIRIYVGNRSILDLTGAEFLEAQELFQGGTTTLNEFFELPLTPIIPGETFIEVTTDGSWAATDKIAVYSLVPNSQ